MRRIDVFNGDADGLCALHQLRLAEPAATELVTGLKREIALLERVQAGAGDEVTVLDISLERNRAALESLLARGVKLRWFDHHYAGAIPSHPGLRAAIDESGEVCTSMLVDRELGGRYRPWAVVAAFGDNLEDSARSLASGLGLDAGRVARLRLLGKCLNYNAYGERSDDQLVQPIDLYHVIHRYEDPLRLLDEEPLVARLAKGRETDLALARAVPPLREHDGGDAWLLPDAPWGRRVIGEYANALATDDAARAHAVLVPNGAGGYTISVRSPRGRGSAAALCRRYPTGGGRALAAGIDHLDPARIEEFLGEYHRFWAEAAREVH